MHLRHPTKALTKDLRRQQKVERKLNPDPAQLAREKEEAELRGLGGGRDRSQSPRRR